MALVDLNSSHGIKKYCSSFYIFILVDVYILSFIHRCGSDAVVGHWHDNIVIIGCKEVTVRYGYDMPVQLVPEIDCVRVISTFLTELIQPVPHALSETYRLNSTSPGSYLLEASRQFMVFM